MTDFQFLSPDGTIAATLRTDYIPVGTIDAGMSVTICDIPGLSTDPNQNTLNAATSLMFANFQKKKYNIYDFITFATTNLLNLVAVPIGTKEGGNNQILNAITLATPTITATVNSATQITINWSAIAGATGYVLQRATNSGFTAGLVTTNLGAVVTDVVTGLVTATEYYFCLQATAPNATSSANSATINATTN